MPVTDLLERNHKLYGDEVALVELNPSLKDTKRTSWRYRPLLLNHTEEKLPGVSLMKKQTA